MAVESDIKSCNLESGLLSCNIKKSKFDYSLIIRPDGSMEVETQSKLGKKIKKIEGSKTLPPIKEIVNTRTLTIVEATGSEYLYIDPPGIWIHVDR